MNDFNHRSCIRDSTGPRAVETGSSRERSRYSRYSRQDDEKSCSKSKRAGDKKSRPKHESTSRHASKSHASSLNTSRPIFHMDIISQPSRAVALGVEVATSMLVSLVYPDTDAVRESSRVDTNRLVGAVSLVAETSTGERVQMETDAMVAQHLVDSVRPIPGEYAERLAQAQPCRVPLGYFSFSNLVIRQSGHYRIRVSLVQIPGAGHSPTTITTHDSEVIRVERRVPTAHLRRQQRA